MEITPRKYFILLRVCLVGLFVFFEFLFVPIIVGIAKESVIWTVILALLGQVVFLCSCVSFLCAWPWVRFTKEKIQVQVLCKTREYFWKDLKQIGVLDLRRNGRNYPDLVILLPGGIPRKSYDMFFSIKNIGRLIHIPNTPAVRDYISEFYGPLDFDAFDGKPES